LKLVNHYNFIYTKRRHGIYEQNLNPEDVISYVGEYLITIINKVDLNRSDAEINSFIVTCIRTKIISLHKTALAKKYHKQIITTNYIKDTSFTKAVINLEFRQILSALEEALLDNQTAYSKINIHKLISLLQTDPHTTVADVAEEFKCSPRTVRYFYDTLKRILTTKLEVNYVSDCLSILSYST
jgi:hypothetical protein